LKNTTAIIATGCGREREGSITKRSPFFGCYWIQSKEKVVKIALKSILLWIILLPVPLAVKAQKTDEFLKKLSAEKSFSGAVLIAKGKKILLHQGYGFADLKKTVKTGSETKFYIASITKQFTAVAILKLEEQGKLSVNDPITKFFKDVPKDKTLITIHHLLTHTAGFAQNYAADGIVSRDQAIKAIFKAPLKSPIGEKFGYVNDDYNLLAIIVEIASGQTYESFLRENLLKPAKLKHTGFWGDAGQIIADTKQNISAEVKMPNWGFRGATGMSSTVGDLYRWQAALFAGKILTGASLEKLLTPHNPTSRGMHAYGWFISETKSGAKVFWTAGYEDFGHNGIIKSYPDGTVIIVLTNSGDIDEKPARDVVINGLETLMRTDK
jgi:CubicO group peptidase (beta-lactamase class C family)